MKAGKIQYKKFYCTDVGEPWKSFRWEGWRIRLEKTEGDSATEKKINVEN